MGVGIVDEPAGDAIVRMGIQNICLCRWHLHMIAHRHWNLSLGPFAGTFSWNLLQSRMPETGKNRVMGRVRIRAALRDDLATLRDVERDSGERYRDYGLDGVAEDEPASVETLAGYADDRRAWVAVDGSDMPVGYILVDIVDGAGHVEQVSVTPAYQGRGIGSALIDQAKSWADSMNLAALTLTTFGHIPWSRHLRVAMRLDL